MGYDDGVLLDEIPGGSFQQLDDAFYLTVPDGDNYLLTTVGVGGVGASLSYAVPLGSDSAWETVFGSLDLPDGALASSSFGPGVDDWRVYVDGSPDVLPKVSKLYVLPPQAEIYLPLVTR